MVKINIYFKTYQNDRKDNNCYFQAEKNKSNSVISLNNDIFLAFYYPGLLHLPKRFYLASGHKIKIRIFQRVKSFTKFFTRSKVKNIFDLVKKIVKISVSEDQIVPVANFHFKILSIL